MTATAARWLTAKEAAAVLRMTPNTVRAHAEAGTIRASKPAGRWLFELADLDEYVARGANTSAAPQRRRRRRAA